MNKAQLIEALADRLGDKKTASQAVEGVVDLIVRNVNKGEKVNITGFGVFEKRARAARTARNPRTGESVKVKKTNVPAFRPGTQFKEVVSGSRKLPRVSAAKTAGTRATASRATTTTRGKATAAKATSRPATKATTTRASSTKASTAKASTAKTRATKASTAKASTARSATKAAPKRTTAKATTTTRSTAKAAPKKTTARKTTKK